jgi:hypothetical protein
VPSLDERAHLPRQVLLEGEVERLLVTRDVQDVAEAVGRDHPDLGARVRERDVRGDRRAMEEVVDLRLGDAGLRAEPRDSVDHAASRIVGRRGDLVHRDPACLLIHEDQVGERPSDVDADTLHVV